jgi:hypothetical protein
MSMRTKKKLKKLRECSKNMKTPSEALTTYAPTLATAANDETFASVLLLNEREIRSQDSGWDAYEVWRTRIKGHERRDPTAR